MHLTSLETAVGAVAASGGLAATLKLGIGLALATYLAEDLTCIGAGILVSQGEISLVAATVSCFIGILSGDLLLVAAGRWLGPSALRKRPLRWVVSAASVERSRHWFTRSGAKVVFLSRFVPGSRLPLFVAAGIVHAPLGRIAALLAAAAALWTPLLVGLSAFTGGAIRDQFTLWEKRALLVALPAIALVLVFDKVLIPSLTWRGRRMLVSKWRRWTRWEFWPLWLFQAPVVLHWIWLGLRFRRPTLFTAANPGIPAGGFVLESKSEILGAVGEQDAVPLFTKLVLPQSIPERIAVVRSAHADLGCGFPVVGKPDVGERGEGVEILRSPAELDHWAQHAPHESLLQEYVDGEEYGVFYVRHPGARRGEIISVTRKVFPEVAGDGTHTIEELDPGRRSGRLHGTSLPREERRPDG